MFPGKIKRDQWINGSKAMSKHFRQFSFYCCIDKNWIVTPKIYYCDVHVLSSTVVLQSVM